MDAELFWLSRALHVAAVVLWIGGVGMVTWVLLPAVRHFKSPSERVEFFEKVEQRFAWQARLWTLVAGVSGFYMVHYLKAWDRFFDPGSWWMAAMFLVWLLFTLMLFVFEPLFLHKLFLKRSAIDPEGTFRMIQRMHWILLAVSLATVMGAVAGSHGWVP